MYLSRSLPARAFSFDSLFSYNHVTNSGFQYDAAGNMTHDASHSYIYDAENRITAVDGGATATYSYNGEGQRSRKMVAGVATDYVYNLGGLVMAEVGSGSTWQREYVYLGRQLVAEYENGTTYFVHGDHLGSTRLLTGYPTASVVECDDYYPFGESIGCGATGTTTHKFTGYERDSESNLDNAQARYNSSSLGRFMSPDPVGNFVADATNPQTWNMYAYVNNNPLAFIDPTGMEPATCDWSNAAGCEADNNLGAFGCTPPYCWSVLVTGNTPTWEQDPNPPQFPVDPCSTGGCSPVSGGGGGGAGGTCYYALANPCGAPQTPQSNKVCTNVPQSRPGASATFNAKLVKQETKGMWPATRLSFFELVFRTGGTFDYKTTQGQQYVDYGNWNFGYVCGANYPALFCQSAAGANRMWLATTTGHNPFGSGIPFVRPPYGDQGPDNQQIRNGIQAQASGCVQ
jgi:RHS repeat-associated protein